MAFSDKLRQLRAEKGISQAKLAEDIHISRSAVAKWENGLGLPSAESLKFLADYFDMSPEELIADPETERTSVEKNRTIEDQSRLIILLLCAIGAVAIIMAFLYFEALRYSIELNLLGVIISILGAYNLRGNIASIHWYNRRKVTRENQLPYCRLVGSGTLVIGLGLIVSSFVQAIVGEAASGMVTLGAVVIGFALILYAQIKYNHGIF